MKDDGTAATTILVTGFGSFPGAPDNPTLGMLEDLETAEIAGVHIATAILPVAFGGVAPALRAAAARCHPDAVLMLGLATRRRQLTLETLARNRAGTRVPDNEGTVPRQGALIEGAPDLLRATWAAPAVLGALREAGHAAALSQDAGDYVCNAALYHALHAGLAPRIGFLHVPAIGMAGTTRGSLAAAARLAVGAMLGSVAGALTGAPVSPTPAPAGAPPAPGRRR